MEDYRMASLKSKLAKLDKERDRIMTTIDVLNEIDSVSVSPNGASQYTVKNGTMIDAILGILRSSGQMMTTADVYNQVNRDRTTTRPSVYSALSRLQKHGKVLKENHLWKMAEER